MAQGKFSNPRPHREEEREIEHAFRQITGKEPAPQPQSRTFSDEEQIERAFRQATGRESASQPQSRVFSEDEEIERAFRQATGRESASQPQSRTFSEDEEFERAFRQATGRESAPTAPQRTAANTKREEFDLLPEDIHAFFDGKEPAFEEEPEESQPDFVDNMLLSLNKAMDFCSKNKKVVMAGLCGVALLLIVIFIAVFFAGSSDPYDSKILNNVLIADVNVGGMTKNEAISAVKAATSNTYGAQDMVVDLSGTEIRFSPKDTGVSLDVKAAVNAAYDYGRTGTQSERDHAYIASRTEKHIIGLLPYLELDHEYIKGVLTSYAEDSGSTLTQTSYGLEGEEPELSADTFNENAPCQTLVITMGTPGIGFDANDVYNQILDAYSLHLFLVEVENVASVKEPDPVDLEAIYEEFYIEPVDASVNMQTFETVPGSYGYGFDLEAAQKLIDKAGYGEEVRIPMEYIAPKILDDASFFRDTLGEYQTRTTNNSSRNTNLQLACEELNNTTLEPGETLSFSNILGKLTSAKGYKSAPDDTGLEETLGGGVGQVSSTLYYAALLSDLDIVSRSNHSFVPSFIDRGLDATTGLKLRNSTSFPIRIEAEVSGGYVKIQILGTEERDYYVALESSISSTVQPQTEYKDFKADNTEGYKDGDVIEEGTTGYSVKSYKIKYDSQTGRELSRDYLANSQYPASNRIVARVEKPEETTAPTEETEPEETTKPTETTAPPETTEATEPPETTEPETEPTTVPTTEPQQELPPISESGDALNAAA